MTRAGPWAAVAAVAALAACGQAGQGNVDNAAIATDPTPPANASGPAETSNADLAADDPSGGANGARASEGSDGRAMEWHFSRTPEGPKLAYGVPRTDNVRLMLRCPSGAGRVILSFIRPPSMAAAGPQAATIAAGGQTASVPVRKNPGQLGTTIEAELAESAAPLQRFRSGDSLEVRWGSETVAVSGRSEGEIGRFFDACG